MRTDLYQSYEPVIRQATEAVHSRVFFAHFPEPPSGKIYGETANEEGLAAFQAQCGQRFELLQHHDGYEMREEVSPYTRERLRISYPAMEEPMGYVSLAEVAFDSWRETDPGLRAAILMESLDRIRSRFFEMAYATMHTTGQTFMMSFQASGPHAADRALEAISLGLHELSRFPQETIEWVKPMGKTEVRMEKRFHNVPLGIGLCIGVSTFPVWNSISGLYANLITGNVSIVKPHPGAIYPMAIVVQELQRTLQAHGQNVHVVQLATDTPAAPITTILAEAYGVKLIDFTGGNAYGDVVESMQGRVTFTEKAGVNSVILDSADDLDAVLNNLAFSLCMYSGQMCTCPQNIFIPRDGVRVGDQVVPYQEVATRLAETVRQLVTNPKMGAGLLGAIQQEATLTRAQQARELGAKVLLDLQEVSNPEFPQARMASPVILEVPADRGDLYSKEMFGPVVVVVPTADTAASLRAASGLAASHGAISCAAYTTDPEVMATIEAEMTRVFTPVSFNFTGNFWVNQNAGFSDFHVTGGNPAGNASIADPLFIRKRFVVVGTRTFKP
ncbi:MAG: aldehyde dehydrogenase family protein [Bacteroidia bacterium]|nr:aldehyde dehydrogenase family protein [Bacteroidia bacterium]